MTNIISIKDNKLILNIDVDNNDTNNDQVKVVSIIGKARGGKSTFSNLLISMLCDQNKTIFRMSDLSTHCTNGVDYYYMKEHKIILLDFQGIYLGDSSQDSKLLLLSYLLSDIIIFNENKILSNNTLQQFEPMLSFIQYINKEELQKVNPKLIFRISDVNLNIEPTSNMQQMLSEQKDQFQSIRDCINFLFDEPFSISTKNLDRNEFKSLKNEEFLEILECDENGFSDAINKILQYIDCCDYKNTYNSFMNKIKTVVDSINNEEKIDYTKLDIVLTLQNYEILEYLTKLDNTLYTEIIVDGTQKLYEENIVSRKKARECVILNTYNKFSTIPKNIIDIQLNKILVNIDKELNKAIHKNTVLAKNILENALNKYLFCCVDSLLEHYNVECDFSKVVYDDLINLSNAEYIDRYILNNLNGRFAQIDNCINNIYVEVYTEYNNTKTKIINEISLMSSNIIDKIKEYINDKYDYTKKYIQNTNENLEQIIKDIELSVREPLNNNIIRIINHLYHKLESELKLDDTTTCKVIVKIDKNLSLTHNSTTVCTPIYVNKLREIIKNMLTVEIKNIDIIINKKQKEYLYEQKNGIDNDKNIIINNPDIIFVAVKFEHLPEKLMTKQYFDDTLKQDFKNIFNILKNKGYVYDYDKLIKNLTDFETIEKTKTFKVTITIDDKYNPQKITDIKYKYIWNLFCHEFRKYYMKNKFTYNFTYDITSTADNFGCFD